MNRRPLALLAIALLTASALAGCFTASAATAKQHQATAADHARSALGGEPVLIAVLGVEGKIIGGFDEAPWGDHPEAQAYMERAEEDKKVGDGRAEVWAYGFVAAADPGNAYLVFIDKGGKKIGELQLPWDEDDLDPIASYALNSDQAMRIALEENDGLRKGKEADNNFFFMFLGNPEDHPNPIWTIAGGGGSPFGGAGGFVVLDAANGDILMSYGGSGDAFGGGDFDWG